MSDEPKPLITAEKLATLLDVNRRTIQNWVREGCPHTPLGPNVHRFNYDDVLAWAAKRASKGKAA